MDTKQVDCRGDLADLMHEAANAETRTRLATATERMAPTRWWQTAVLLGGTGIVAAVIIAAVT